ncbi:MAG TPA: allantoicase [Bacteroidota bacterium]|nr:allantoicase [Bacteroidota bacterium]
MPSDSINAFAGLIDLASERLGGRVLVASDEFFAEKENLLKSGAAIFIPDKYTRRGKWMDGWETRRRRTPGHDWCIIKLGCAGALHGVDIDTSHFLGNNPSYASIEACSLEGNPSAELLTKQTVGWEEILPKSPLKAGSHNVFALQAERRWTHIRLNIYPDGGVARLRLFGTVIPDWRSYKKGSVLDLAAVENGGVAVAASDMFFSPMNNLLMPGRATNMGDGWETRRRRGPGHDWVIVKLGRPGLIKKIEVDTNHFKGNYPDQCSIDTCYEPSRSVDALTWPDVPWMEILPRTKLSPHARHFFQRELKNVHQATHVRLNIYPDGGVSRLRVWGTIKTD